jgi:hypothetical protein
MARTAALDEKQRYGKTADDHSAIDHEASLGVPPPRRGGDRVTTSTTTRDKRLDLSD